jgi:hypothetical protein
MSQTINADTIFVRDIIFKDGGNYPIPANRYLLTRGDGGIYFGSNSNGIPSAFNAFRAGDIQFVASNAYNTLWFEAGAGIQFVSTIGPGNQPKLWVAATAPDQLQIYGGSTLSFADLPDDLSGGKTLVYAAVDDMNISISDNIVLFGTKNASTFSSILALQSTTANLQSTSEVLSNDVSTLYGYANIFYVSTAVSSFYSSLINSELGIAELSTFVNSTFVVSSGALNITYPNVYISSLAVDELQVPLISTFSTLFWSTASGRNTSLSSASISTIVGNDSQPILTFDGLNRRVGVNLGGTQPRATVDVNGIVYATNFVTSSDPRLKENIERLDTPKELPGAYRFTWASNKSPDIGLLADEVEAIAPECVIVGDDGFKAVNYAKLVPLCFSAIAELRERVAALEGGGSP